jgi:hypothetical protein
MPAMVDDNPEAAEPLPDSARARRAPRTIDLEASEVSGETQDKLHDKLHDKPRDEPVGGGADAPPQPARERASAGVVFPALVAVIFGAGSAALVIAAASYLGWPAPPAASKADSAVIDSLAARIASVESRTSESKISEAKVSESGTGVAANTAPSTAAPDPEAAARIAALEKSLGSLRGELASLRAQSEKLAADVGAVKSAPREAAAAPDLSGINDRIAGIEGALSAQASAIRQEGAKPADDTALRRVVVASMLDIRVRQGEPFATALAAAKSLSPKPDLLKPLDGFSASGVPSAAALSRELLTLVPKLSPPAPESATTGSSLVDRLQAGAAKLVRIERTDAVGNGPSAIVARVTAAALRNDAAEARRELNTLAPGERAAAQAWLDKSDARDAALAASHQFATEAMAALAQPGQ